MDASCPHMASCALYPLFRLRANLSLWQERYCQAHYQECERFKLSENGQSVPDNLLPNGMTLGKKA